MLSNFLLLNNPHSQQGETLKQYKSSPQVAIITGADGHLGRAFGQLLPQQSSDITALVLVGKNLLTNYNNDTTWQTELSKLLVKKVNLQSCLLLDLDFNVATAANDLLALISQKIGANWRLKWLINNAGVGFKGPLSCQPETASSTCLTVNTLFPTLLISALLNTKRFAEQQAYVINVASSSAFAPQANFAVYSASKSYLFYLSQALRAEWQANKLHINCSVACPGPMQSQFLKNANLFTHTTDCKNLVWYKKLALEEANIVASKAIKAVLINKAVSYSNPLTCLFRFFTKCLPSSLFAYFTSRNNA